MNIKCPQCGKASKVVDSRPSADNTVRRRRHCMNNRCKERFTTYEMLGDEYHDCIEAWNMVQEMATWSKEVA